MKKTAALVAIIFLPSLLAAQLNFFGYVEYGFAANKFKSTELPAFFSSYNSYEAPFGLTTPFPEKLKIATGDYFKFGIGVGGKTQMIMDFGVLKARTAPHEARFSSGGGRDIIVDLRNSNTDIGIRIGGTEEIPVWFQFDINVLIQVVSIESWYVFPDGSKSITDDHSLNGIFRDFYMTTGLGVTAGTRVYGPLHVFVHGDYIPNFGKSHPEYHQFEDLNEFKNANEFIPRDMPSYVAGNNGMDNAISDDLRGFHFTAGLQIKIGKK